MKRFYSLSALTAALLLSGCGGGSGSDIAATETTAYFVDSAVQNADYDCLDDNEFNKTTGPDGAFSCRHMSHVRFRIGSLELGEVTVVPGDNHVFPQDLAGVPRSDINDTKVLKIATLLQSLDADGNATNGIELPETAKEAVTQLDVSDISSVEDVHTLLEEMKSLDVQIHEHTEEEVQNHLRETLQHVHANTNSVEATAEGKGSFDLSAYATTPNISDALKETVAYMGNEERLAHDVYLALYDYHIQNSDTALESLYNIATRSETRHVEIVQSVVHRYEEDGQLDTAQINDLNPVAESNVTLENMPAGKYGIAAIQQLYDTLYAKGIQSPQDALEVGCMVEVTDVEDLNRDIALAQSEGAEDIVAAYETLRAGSYNHYRGFDKALKNMGVSEGCCVLGEAYCKDYPQNDHGGSSSQRPEDETRPMDGSGMKKGAGRH